MNIAKSIIDHRVLVSLLWLLIAAGLLPFTGSVQKNLQARPDIEGGHVARIEEIWNSEFILPFSESAVLVISGIPGPDNPEGEELLFDITDRIYEVDGVTGTVSYLLTSDPLFLSTPESGGSGTFLNVGLRSGDEPIEELILRLQAMSAELEEDYREDYPDIVARWTGEVALSVDMRAASIADVQDAEIRVAPITLVLLLLTFGSIVAASLPLLAGAFAITLTLGLIALLSEIWSISVVIMQVVSMLGLGLSIDYALLTVNRFREQLTKTSDVIEAAIETTRQSGRTVLVAGIAVAIGLGAMFVIPINELSSIAIGGLVVVTFAMAISAMLLPALLATIGHRVNSGRIPILRNLHIPSRWWRNWGLYVGHHPWRVLIISIIPLILLASQATRLEMSRSGENWFPKDPPAVRAIEDLRNMGRGGVVQMIRLMISMPEGKPVDSEEGWSSIWRLSGSLLEDPRISHVRSVTQGSYRNYPTPELFHMVPSILRDMRVSRDDMWTVIDIVPDDSVDGDGLRELVVELRGPKPFEILDLPGAEILVGGLPAFNYEYEEAVNNKLIPIVSAVLGVTFLVLAIWFKSFLIPLKAVTLNLLSVAAAFGAAAIVVQDGNGAWLLGMSSGTGTVLPIVPVVVFCGVFGLSMDYEVFLVARLQEAKRDGMNDIDAIAHSLERTGGVITSAAAIMIAIFGAFMLGEFVLIKTLGFALAVAVFLDATIVRLCIGPALFKIGGKWNWWPGQKWAQDQP